MQPLFNGLQPFGTLINVTQCSRYPTSSSLVNTRQTLWKKTLESVGCAATYTAPAHGGHVVVTSKPGHDHASSHIVVKPSDQGTAGPSVLRGGVLHGHMHNIKTGKSIHRLHSICKALCQHFTKKASCSKHATAKTTQLPFPPPTHSTQCNPPCAQ